MLSDRAEISALVDAYALSLDERRFDPVTAAGLFTPGVEFDLAVGGSTGLDGYAEASRELFGGFAFSQHVTANHVIELGGDRARVRWNAIVTHVHGVAEQVFGVGGLFTAVVERTVGGWRFARIELRAGWTTGSAPVSPPGG